MTDAVLLVSHGTVDDLNDLPAFVTNVRRGHPPSSELVAELRRRYEAIGGRSPLDSISAALAEKVERRLGVRAAWASRLWKPTVRDALEGLAREGVGRVALVPLAQHSAHVYVEDARRAATGTGATLVCAPSWGQSSRLHAAFAARIEATLASAPELERTTLLFTAHSLPRSVIDAGDPYERDFRAAAGAIAALVVERGRRDVHCAVAFQSQGMGGPGPGGRAVEWLGPDLGAALDLVAERGDRHVVFAPAGFLADHVEILYDLDIEARELARSRGLSYARIPSLNADADFVEVLVEVARPLLER